MEIGCYPHGRICWNFNVPALILFALLPCLSIQELSELPPPSSGIHVASFGQTIFGEKPAFPNNNAHPNPVDNPPMLSRLNTPLANTENVSLHELAENISRLEGNFASLIQSFLALQRSVFNLEQLQELLVLLLEDILKQTGNIDTSAKDGGRVTGSSSSDFDDSDSASDSDSDDGVDSAEIDETGEDTADGNDNPDEDGKINAGGGGGSGGGGGGGDGGGNQGQGGTDPFNDSPDDVRGARDALGTGGEVGRKAVTKTQKHTNRRFGNSNRLHHDSDGGGSSEGRASGSREEEDTEGGASMRPNSVRPKGNSIDKSPPIAPIKPQFAEPMVALTTELEARLNDMIQRLNPNAVGQESHRRLAHLRAPPPLNPHHTHLGESPLAPRPIFEPLEILSGDTNDSPSAKGIMAHLHARGVRVSQRMPVVSHGGPLVGPEDFSSPFMERLDGMQSGENPNERSTGMISDLKLEQFPTGYTGVPEAKIHQQTNTKKTTASFASGLDDQISPAYPISVKPALTPDDNFDHSIATLLKDLSDHLKEQRAYQDEQSRINGVIDQAVIELSKLTWVLKPAQSDSAAIPAYKVHMATKPPSTDAKFQNESKDTETVLISHAESSDGKKDDESSINSQGPVSARILTTQVPDSKDTQMAQTVEVHDNNDVNQQPYQAVTSTINPTESSHDYTPKANEKDKTLNKNTPGPWDWLRSIENSSNLQTDMSLNLLIDLLSELSSEEHGMSKDLALFSSKGRRLTTERIKTESAEAENNQGEESTEAPVDTATPMSNKPNGNKYNLDDDDDEDYDSAESEEDKTDDEDDSILAMEEMSEIKRTSDHGNSLFSNTYAQEDSNNIGNYNETDSIEDSEFEDAEEDSDESSEESDEEDDDPSIVYNIQENEQDEKTGVHKDQIESHVVENPMEESNIRIVQNQVNDINNVKDLDYALKDTDKDRRAEMNHNDNHDHTVNIHDMAEDDGDEDLYEQEGSEENESSDSNDDDYDHKEAQRPKPGAQLFGPPILDGQFENAYPNRRPPQPNYGRHVLTERDTQNDQNPASPGFRIRKSLRQSKSRGKRQADLFWQQFLNQGMNPLGQQGFPANQDMQSQGNPHDHSGIFGLEGLQSHGGLVSQGHLQGHRGLQGQGGLPNQGTFQTLGHPHQGQGQQHTQNGIHQTPIQHVNPLQSGSVLGQYPLPPFRGYPQYSRYNSYLGFNYPHFGYSGYPGLNHEPGEYPSIETGPSADVMEEVLNNLFQRYWENVRNMLAKQGPTTPLENEYEGPITTTSPTTTTTTTRRPTTAAATTPAAPTSKAAPMTTTKKSRMRPPFESLTTSTKSPTVESTNNTVNATDVVHNSNNQTSASDPMTGNEGLAGVIPTKSGVQNFLIRTTNRNTALPPNFFQRKPSARTTNFPFF